MSRRRRPELVRPSLKQLTPIEQARLAKATAEDRKRWEYLFSLNVWKPSR